jgi:hypothetical protein
VTIYRSGSRPGEVLTLGIDEPLQARELFAKCRSRRLPTLARIIERPRTVGRGGAGCGPAPRGVNEV